MITHANQNTTPWTPEKIATLIQLHKQGRSFNQIAHEMKMTRNQVCGKLDRLGLVGAESRRIRTYHRRINMNPRKIDRGDWDMKLFEPWAVRKERIQRERANVR